LHCRFIVGNPLANISPLAFRGADIRGPNLQVRTDFLHCCGAEWLAYGIPGQKRITIGGGSASSLVCASPQTAQGRDLLAPVAQGGLYDLATKPAVCPPVCQSDEYLMRPAVAGADGSIISSCVAACPVGYAGVALLASAGSEGRECIRCTRNHLHMYRAMLTDPGCAVCHAGADPAVPFNPSNCTACLSGYLVNPDQGCVRGCNETIDGAPQDHYGATAGADPPRCHRCTDYANCTRCPSTPNVCTECTNGLVLSNGTCKSHCPASVLKPGRPATSDNDLDFKVRWAVSGGYADASGQQRGLYCRQTVGLESGAPMPHLALAPVATFVNHQTVFLSIRLHGD